MKRSQLFAKVSKTAPSDEVSKNAQLLIQAGFIHKEMAGVYTFLPLGHRVMQKIMQIIREEMNAIGGQELSMTALQSKELWEKTDRWSDKVSDVWFKSALKNKTEVGLGWTHEEPVTAIAKTLVNSYRDLPFSLYQFQTKFRNETRAKSGIMRCREFIMKDLYSFSRTKEEHDAYYEKAQQAYTNIFNRLGFGADTYLTFASGGPFSKFSHEYQTVCDAGEDIIYVDEAKKIAVNQEVFTDEVLESLGLNRADMVEKKASEVGNIFTLGTRFSEPLELKFKDENGEDQLVFMGCYGIGPSRSMGVVVEHFSDERGIVWPKEIAPYAAQIIPLAKSVDEPAYKAALALYEELTAKNVEVLFDDRIDMSPGAKFAEHDLIGIPHRFVLSAKTLEAGKIEYKERTSKDFEMIDRAKVEEILGDA